MGLLYWVLLSLYLNIYIYDWTRAKVRPSSKRLESWLIPSTWEKISWRLPGTAAETGLVDCHRTDFEKKMRVKMIFCLFWNQFFGDIFLIGSRFDNGWRQSPAGFLHSGYFPATLKLFRGLTCSSWLRQSCLDCTLWLSLKGVVLFIKPAV